MSLNTEGAILFLLIYIVASVAAGAVIGRRIGYTICKKAKIVERSRRFVSIMIISIILGGALGPLIGISCLLSTGPG